MPETKPSGSASSSSAAPNATRKPPRQMAAKACERCRRRKIKCDEFFPCGQCTRMRVACKIEDPAEKRREQQQSAMEDRIKRLEALLIATYTNPNNRIDMNIPPGLDQEGLLSNPALSMAQGAAATGPAPVPPGVKLEPPRLTLQTPSSPEFRGTEATELLSAGEYSLGYPYWSPPASIAPSAPASASDYFPSDPPPWSTTGPAGLSDPKAAGLGGKHGRHTRASSISMSETSQEEHLSSPPVHDRNRFSVDTSGSTLDIPQIEVTSWDHSRPQSPAGFTPAPSPGSSMMDMDMGSYYPPDLSIGSWSGLSSPSIMAPAYPFEDNMLVVNQSLPSHSRRSSLNSLSPDYEYNEPKRRRAASDVFPIPQQFVFPEGTSNSLFTNPGVHAQSLQDPNLAAGPQPKDDVFNHTFIQVIYPLFPILFPQNMPGNPSQNFTTPQPLSASYSDLSPQIAQTQAFLTRAISAFILSQRNAQSTLPAQTYFAHGLKSHGAGKWDSLPGIQTGILLGIFILVSGFQAPNLYLLNASIVAACLDLGLHKSLCQQGSLEANTLLAAYVLDRTVAIVRDRPVLLKDEDLHSDVVTFLNAQLRERAERGSVRRCSEGGRLWDWWASFEGRVRGDIGLDLELGGEGRMEQGFSF